MVLVKATHRRSPCGHPPWWLVGTHCGPQDHRTPQGRTLGHPSVLGGVMSQPLSVRRLRWNRWVTPGCGSPSHQQSMRDANQPHTH